MSLVVEVDGLSKAFSKDLKKSLVFGLKDVVREVSGVGLARDYLRPTEFWSLRDINLSLKKGETLGLIGHNGAGKSTLLKILNGLMKPNAGRVKVTGRVGALIELGAGFSPILTGRENIMINGAVLGLSKKETLKRVDEIIEFAEIDDFIDSPVKNYSSGMRVRLGFAVASHMNPDIMLVDEVLSVGDSSFRQRCVDRLGEFQKGGRSLIFVSHNMLTVETVCDRVIMLKKGEVCAEGESSDVVLKYEQEALEVSMMHSLKDQKAALAAAEPISIEAVLLNQMGSNGKVQLDESDGMLLEIRFQVNQEIPKALGAVSLRKNSPAESPILGVNMDWSGDEMSNLKPGRSYSLKCQFKTLQITPGNYFVRFGIQDQPSGSMGQKWFFQPKTVMGFNLSSHKIKTRFENLPAYVEAGGLPAITPNVEWTFQDLDR
jgi:ABC-type polysaccharide/polyol phosphate transport system ATPase subunit